MTSEMQQYKAIYLEVRDARCAGRAISKHLAISQMRVSAVDTEADVAAAKVDAVTHVAGTAMTAVAKVAQAQMHLEQLVPQASARLNFLADAHALAMGDVLADIRRDVLRK